MLYLIGFGCIIVGIISILIWIKCVFGTCSKCSTYYYYSDTLIVPSNATSSLKETKWRREEGNKAVELIYYGGTSLLPSNGTSSLKETKWKREQGNKAIELIRYPLCREWKCKSCNTVSFTWVWSKSLWDWTKPYRDEKSFWHDRLAKQEWTQEGEAFDVIDCPMCASKGSISVVVDANISAQYGLFNGSDLVYRREQYGSGLCGFCNGQGCIKPEKLDLLQKSKK